MADDKSTTGKFGEDVKRQLEAPTAKEFVDASDALNQYARKINETFTQGRQRISELSTALADATPNVRRLGGDIENVQKIISEVAQESRRNVIANTEDVEKLFAASKVLGTEAGILTKAFMDIGAGIETIPKALEESIQYVQSIGGNAKDVMGTVVANMEQMNRYQFEGGVQGLTKMAAQASMLRFDMSQTFNLAEKVLSPERAIETAAAFQRLGVASGALADPFALMNASINDPGALQDSLVDVAKQFTYFDEKTKTFKISPQGVLTLKEMEDQTGVSAKEMSKLGLAAAEADKRISAIGSAGLNIKEDDKQYIANIAKMGEGGEYEVKLRDESGIEQTRKLSELTQDEFDKLIKEQKEGPKTLEDIARSQMSLSEITKNDVAAIRAKFVGGLVSSGQVLETREGIQRGVTAFTGAASRAGTTRDVRKESERAISDVGQLKDDILKNNMSITDALSKYLERAGNQAGEVSEKLKQSMTKALEEARDNTTDKTAIERAMQQGYDYVLDKVAPKTEAQKTAGGQPISSLIEGKQTQVQQAATGYAPTAGSQNQKVEFAGGIKVDVNFSGEAANLSQQQKEEVTKMFVDKMSSLNYQNFQAGMNGPQNPTKAPVSTNYTR